MRPSPVKVIKPDGSSHVTSAHDFRHRPDEEPLPPEEVLTPETEVTRVMLEAMTMKTLYRVMRDSDKFSERTSAATAAVKFMAVKDKVGPVFGEELDSEA